MNNFALFTILNLILNTEIIAQSFLEPMDLSYLIILKESMFRIQKKWIQKNRDPLRKVSS